MTSQFANMFKAWLACARLSPSDFFGTYTIYLPSLWGFGAWVYFCLTYVFLLKGASVRGNLSPSSRKCKLHFPTEGAEQNTPTLIWKVLHHLADSRESEHATEKFAR